MIGLLKRLIRPEPAHPTERLSEYLDGGLPAEERVAIDRHLATCADCRAELESLRATVVALRALPTLRAPRSFVLSAAVVPAPRPPLRLTWVPAASAGLAMVLAVLSVSATLNPSRVSPAVFDAGSEQPASASSAQRAASAKPSEVFAPAPEQPPAALRQAPPAKPASEPARPAASAPAPGGAPSASGGAAPSAPAPAAPSSAPAAAVPAPAAAPPPSAPATAPAAAPAAAAPGGAASAPTPAQPGRATNVPARTPAAGSEAGLAAGAAAGPPAAGVSESDTRRSTGATAPPEPTPWAVIFGAASALFFAGAGASWLWLRRR
ncbi:MAG: zf-HC2 domain-containing protein [Chloroflexi bacterium]|nr:zf-HC2 domain-containing protein [Chloroflexota bacterium]